VVGVEDQQHIQRLDDFRPDFIRTDRRAEHHVEKVRAVLEVVARIDKGFADRFLVREGGDRAQLAHQACGRDVDRFFGLLGAVLREFGIESGKRHHHRREDRHRVGVIREPVEKVAHVFVDHRVLIQEA